VAAILRAVRARDVSALEIVETCLARIRDLEPRINAFITISDEQARILARARLPTQQWRPDCAEPARS
jgi:Asp-tRNA(Asn)/Glu-tRNA(Gln) amidotransferase A subunit family amidase